MADPKWPRIVKPGDVAELDNNIAVVSPHNPELLKQVEAFKQEWSRRYEFIASQKTFHKSKTRKVGKERDPQTGQMRDKIERYLEEKFMRSAMDKYFPGWSWNKAHEPAIIANRGIVATGMLEIIDIDLFHYLISMGVPKERAYFTRSFMGWGGAIIQAKADTGQVVSANWTISNPAKSANTEALKYAINRLTHFGDDTYKKEDASIGLTFMEFKDLSEFIVNSDMSESDKEQAFRRLHIINSSQIEELKQVILKKEANNASESNTIIQE
jgi:hypothetical protein